MNLSKVKYLKYSIVALVIVLVGVMATATCVENVKGTPFVAEHVYGTWWFVMLWAMLSATGAAYILKSGMQKRLPVFLLHVSFLVILAGAFTTFLTSERGSVHLREGETVTAFMKADGTMADLGFELALKSFSVECYPGTDSPMDYVSQVEADSTPLDISMNNIGRYRGCRFTQAGYDNDMKGTRLGVLYDPWGIALAYTGYALLLISMILVLCSKASQLRFWYRKSLGGNAMKLAVFLSFLCAPLSAGATPRPVDDDVADAFGNIAVLYGGRVCPVSTVANDFVTKLSGKAGWNGYGSMQIFAGWTFRPSDWEREPMILIKDKVARKVLGINGKWASYDDFWNSLNVYKLKTPLEKAYKEGDAAMVKHLRDADEKFNIIRMFYNGELLRMFPYTSPDGKMTWVAPGQKDIDLMLPEKEWNFVRRSMDYLTESVQAGNDNARALQIIDKIVDYQRLRASAVMPSAWRLRCETIYGYLNSMRWPVMLYLTLSLLLAICFSLGMADGRDRLAGYAIIGTMLAHLTVLLTLRWIVSGHVPLSSGFETMLFLAWSILLFTLLVLNKFPIIMGFAPLLASFAMLVAMIGSGSPRITPLMPVLQSPLLSVHVMVIMFSYALFALMMLIGVQGLVMHWKGDAVREESFAALSHTLLYPAVFLLTVGIFVGAVWANVSWGCYWSWDPKEVWALITMFVYMAPLHSSSLKSFRKPIFFHVYCIVAFLSVLMTYFGVNFFLGGMHSYA